MARTEVRLKEGMTLAITGPSGAAYIFTSNASVISNKADIDAFRTEGLLLLTDLPEPVSPVAATVPDAAPADTTQTKAAVVASKKVVVASRPPERKPVRD